MKPEELRELDAWIAEHVMGYRWALDTAERRSDYPRGSLFIKGTLCLIEGRFSISKVLGWARPRGGEKRAPGWDYDVPFYTRRGESAMLVLEKCAVGSSFTHLTKLGDKWIIYQGTDARFSERVEADTLPLVICRFARSLFP